MQAIGIENKGKEEIEDLISNIRNDRINGGIKAACIIGKFGARAVPPLMQTLKHEDRCVRWLTAIALTRVGAPALGPVSEVLGDPDPSVRVPAIWVMEQVGGIAAVEPLLGILHRDGDEFCRYMAASALKKIGDPLGVAAVEDLLGGLGTEARGIVDELVEGS